MKTGAVDLRRPDEFWWLDGWCARKEADTVVEGEDLAGVAGKPRG